MFFIENNHDHTLLTIDPTTVLKPDLMNLHLTVKRKMRWRVWNTSAESSFNLQWTKADNFCCILWNAKLLIMKKKKALSLSVMDWNKIQ